MNTEEPTEQTKKATAHPGLRAQKVELKTLRQLQKEYKMQKPINEMSTDELRATFLSYLKITDTNAYGIAVIIHRLVEQRSALETANQLAKHGATYTLSEVQELAEIGGQDVSDKNLKRLRLLMIGDFLRSQK